MDKVFVTESFLPPLKDYIHYLERIWEEKRLTNKGPCHELLEERISEYLGIDSLILSANGTLALQLIIKAFDLSGEVITTPFSYVATTSSLLWENCTPRFVDIEDQFYTIDPEKIRKLINEKTTAILVTHVFGNPCDVECLDNIAKEYGLKIIYDGAHAFGVKYRGQSLLSYGDASICSFHATKLFNTAEGGMVHVADEETFTEVERLRRFGHDGPCSFKSVGINAKMSELHAALGLCNLEYLPQLIVMRRDSTSLYNELLGDCLSLRLPQIREETESNYSYYPILIDSSELLTAIVSALEANDIYPRRYFYPSLNTCLNYVENHFMKNSENISKRVFCLPLYFDLEIDVVKRICSIINHEIKI